METNLNASSFGIVFIKFNRKVIKESPVYILKKWVVSP